MARCQALLQQGRRVVDVAYLYSEGSPVNFNNIDFALPKGYDFDFCTTEIIEKMTVKDGEIYLPNGVSYKYLLLPDYNRLTLRMARKVQELRNSGAKVYLQKEIVGTPGLKNHVEADSLVRKITADWPILPEGGWNEVFEIDNNLPDFEGKDLMWIHRIKDNSDFYFVANTQPAEAKEKCIFKVSRQFAELWNPETGEIFELDVKERSDGRLEAALQFEPAQSWFVVFKDNPSSDLKNVSAFSEWVETKEIEGKWELDFNEDWGPDEKLVFNELKSWSESSDSLAKYYSGSVIYHKEIKLAKKEMASASKPNNEQLLLDLGNVEVMARVKVNGIDCGITWKPPYRVEIGKALKIGKNKLEIEVVNTWVNRMIGDEQLPLDAEWKDWETLIDWPEWFLNGETSPTGRYTFTTGRHYQKDSPLMPSGLLGPVKILRSK